MHLLVVRGAASMKVEDLEDMGAASCEDQGGCSLKLRDEKLGVEKEGGGASGDGP